MLNKYQTKRQEGFTIIEVLIVLAIAGLIILIVFLAVPALQRNSRNTQRRNDVQTILGSIQEYSNNNNGALPPDTATAVANAKLGFYDPADIIGNTNRTSAEATITSDGKNVQLNNYTKCDANPGPNTADVALNANPTRRNVTAIFQVETRTGFQAQCLDM